MFGNKIKKKTKRNETKRNEMKRNDMKLMISHAVSMNHIICRKSKKLSNQSQDLFVYFHTQPMFDVNLIRALCIVIRGDINFIKIKTIKQNKFVYKPTSSKTLYTIMCFIICKFLYLLYGLIHYSFLLDASRLSA